MLRKNFFVNWFKEYGRDFPWRRDDTSPFAILVTEMLLRQTRAPAVARLWQRLMEKYPDAHAMASASKERLVEELRILGFGNMRARALISAARWLVEYYDGEVPSGQEELLEISHVGSYAAQAVRCFAFGKRVEIVDTNVQRFFARYYNLKVKPDIRRNPHVVELARQALPRERNKARLHNYGLLDFTAEVCKPGRPRCEICPLSSSCEWGIKQLNRAKHEVKKIMV